MVQLIKVLSMYVGIFVIFSIFFLLSFWTPLFSGGVLFYRGIILSLISFILTLMTFAIVPTFFNGLLEYSLRKRLETILAGSIASLTLHLCFFVVVPVTIDRSVSTFLLSRMNTTDGAELKRFSKADLRKIFVDEYLDGMDAMGRRLNEQLISKNITPVQDDQYVLTAQGQAFLSFAKSISILYGIKPTYISNEK